MDATGCTRSIGAFLLLPLLLQAADQKHRTIANCCGNLPQPTGTPQATLININNVSAWYSSTGEQERNPFTRHAGVVYPRGTATAVYAAGILWGGKFRDGQAPTLRVNGQAYNNGTKPGMILGLRTGITETPAAPDVRIWRVRRDFATADLRIDASELFRTPVYDVTDSMILALRNQYAMDWEQWPWQKGAPFYDKNGDGIRQPDDEPGLANADQVIWFVCNDVGVAQPWSCPTSGIEQQTTIWGYNESGPLGNVVFKRYRLIYKGVSSTSSLATIDSMYFTQFTDTDLGFCCDDYCGCDTLLDLGYTYNGKTTDTEYAKYGLLAPPAFGNVLLQGPRVATGSSSDIAYYNFTRIPGYRNRQMTTFFGHVTGGHYSDPPYSYTGAIEWYQIMRGLPPTPTGPPDPLPLYNYIDSVYTYYYWPGDPVTGTGWYGGWGGGPGDSRYAFSSGPFSMAVGDTQEIVVADVGGLGTSNLNSITVLESNVIAARDFFVSLANPTAVNIDGGPEGTRPEHFTLLQNYPNPFNPSTQIQYGLPQASHVRLTIYSTLGAEIVRLVDEMQQPGYHSVEWDGRTAIGGSVASSVYVYRLEAGAFVESRKMLLMR